jgi:hypothetical protein
MFHVTPTPLTFIGNVVVVSILFASKKSPITGSLNDFVKVS